MEDDEVINVGQAAKLIGVDRTTLWRMYAKYKMIAPPARFSIGKTGYLRSYIVQWKRDRMAESTQGVG